MASKDFKFLQDAPIGKTASGFYDFYHKNIAPALKQILENETCVHTIGLFGKWGTGKSTIIKLLKDEGVTDATIVEFDCWKYEKDSLRRQLLLQIAKDLKLNKGFIDDLEKEFYFSISEKVSEKLGISWAHVCRLFIYALAFGGAIFYVAYSISPDPINHLKTFFSVSGALGLAIGVIIDKFMTDDLKKIIMISPVTATKNQMDSAELFEASFVKVIKRAKAKKIIIVIDNLDRVDSNVATEVLSTLKTFLEIREDKLDKKKVIFLVPCDFDAIKRAAPSAELAHEFLRKIFNIALWTPEFISADIRGFIKNQIKDTGDISSLLDDEDVILVIETAFGNSPREIKQFLNNLVSSIVVASNTEVKEIIEENIAYLAKIQVLIQKYPEAYQALKQYWYAPESISTTYADLETSTDKAQKAFAETFKNFMLGTSRISAVDAEPFIYFKVPVVNTSLSNSEGIRLNLIEANETEAKELIEKETNKDAVVEYVLSLLNKYQGQPEILKNIYKTQLAIFSEAQLTSKTYVNTAAFLLDARVWPFFKEFSADIIFPFLLSATNLEKTTREKVLERYVLTLEAEEFKNLQNPDLLKKIITNLIEYQGLLTLEQKKKIAVSVEQTYINQEDIISLFVGKKSEETFLTIKALQEFINGINLDNFAGRKNILTKLSDLVVARNLYPIIFDRFGNLLTSSNSQATEHNDKKEKLLENIFNLILSFKKELEKVGKANASAFARQVIETFQNTSAWDNKKLTLLILIYISTQTEDPLPNDIRNLRLQFIRNAGVTVIKEVLDQCGTSYAQSTIKTSLDDLYPRITSEQGFGKMIYLLAAPEQRELILSHLINNVHSTAITFIASLNSKDYTRADVVKLLLQKALGLEPLQRPEIYNFISDKLNLNDDIAIKELAIDQIKNLLIQENNDVAGVGFNFLTNTNFLGDEKKREIAKTVLEFLRTPGKLINEHNRFSLKTLSTLFSILQDTPKQDFVYSLFNALKPDRNLQAIQVIIESLSEIQPSLKAYEKDFKDLLETLKSWPEGETKQLVLESILKLKPETSKDEFWNEIESLLPKPPKEEKES
jgi:hypothetical protein